MQSSTSAAPPVGQSRERVAEDAGADRRAGGAAESRARAVAFSVRRLPATDASRRRERVRRRRGAACHARSRGEGEIPRQRTRTRSPAASPDVAPHEPTARPRDKRAGARRSRLPCRQSRFLFGLVHDGAGHSAERRPTSAVAGGAAESRGRWTRLRLVGFQPRAPAGAGSPVRRGQARRAVARGYGAPAGPSHESRGPHATESTAARVRPRRGRLPARARGGRRGRRDPAVDFPVEHNDGSFELVETKGFETRDWKMPRDEIEVLWLPEHPDYIYTVVR
ncbi:MAG: hypothetical protein LAQ69_07160 [Acidobacteriia bacterium]|nr:hypothetical protein [Terriglobia bacterium]